MAHGLTSREASERLAQYGPNTIAGQHKLPALVAFLSRFKNPLVIILILAATLSAFVGDIISFVIIIAIVTLSVILDFVNTYKSEKAAEELKNKVRVMSEVIRNGTQESVPLTELVPGDVVVLSAGKLIPADGKMIEGKDFYVNESSLNGESFPSAKQPQDPVYMGSSVTSGSAFMEVTATGKLTKFSHIAQALSGKEEQTEFDKEIQDFSYLIIRITFFLVVVIFAVNAIFKHDVLGALLFSLALAVGLTPELLPLIITLNLTKGSLAMAKKGVIVKQLSAIQNFGSMDVFCTDKTGTLTEDRIALVKYVNGVGEISDEVLLYAYLTSDFSSKLDNPLDRAIKGFRHLSTHPYKRLDEVPFTFERKRESVVVEHEGKLMITMGAPEEVLRIAAHYQSKPMAGALKQRVESEYETLSADGYRVLAIATKEVTKSTGFEAFDEVAMEFQGFIAFLDPAKKSVTATLQKMHEYGVAIKIISGDNALVNQKIASEIHLDVKGLLTGEQIEKLNDAELSSAVELTTIFARVNPEQKMRIIKTLKANGHVVGYMGDGINDAPSLRAADIGVSVNNAVDVAKDTADLILMHKSLHELVEGIIEGRKTFANTLKYLMMALSSNFGNMFSMAGASIFLPFLPMLATQILFNNLLYDASQFAIPVDNVDEDSIKQPHKLSMVSIKKFMWVFGPLSSLFDLTTFAVLLFGFRLTSHGFQTGWFLESILTQIFVVYIIRTKRIPFIQSWPSRALLISTLAFAALACLAVFSPLGIFFKFEVLRLSELAAIAIIVAAYLFSAQLVKVQFYRRVSF